MSHRAEGQAFVEDFLAHYASKYYDPIKAKEYYERTKELKGRKPAAGELRTKSKKQAWEYAKNQIGEAKKGEFTQLSESRKEFLEEVRQRAAERRERISEKLKEALKSLTEEKKLSTEQLSELRKSETNRIAEETAAKIAALPEIPKGLSKERRAELAAERSSEIAKIRGEAATQKQELSDALASEKAVVLWNTTLGKGQKRDEASVDREAVSNELKATVEKARENFKALREQVKAKYERESLKEFEAIKTNV